MRADLISWSVDSTIYVASSDNHRYATAALHVDSIGYFVIAVAVVARDTGEITSHGYTQQR